MSNNYKDRNEEHKKINYECFEVVSNDIISSLWLKILEVARIILKALNKTFYILADIIVNIIEIGLDD